MLALALAWLVQSAPVATSTCVAPRVVVVTAPRRAARERHRRPVARPLHRLVRRAWLRPLR
ncbi:MAG: hypothetical protein IAE78_01415 [Myxococcus sp.]|nr:hypothetical protein [Myxococcus sp.]